MAAFIFPCPGLNERHPLAHAINKCLKIFLAQDLLMEESGVNGPVCDAVAKKPWLASVMSFCSLVSASPMATFMFQPLQLSRGGCASLAACPAQPRHAHD